jgi:hypothetical protein
VLAQTSLAVLILALVVLGRGGTPAAAAPTQDSIFTGESIAESCGLASDTDIWSYTIGADLGGGFLSFDWGRQVTHFLTDMGFFLSKMNADLSTALLCSTFDFKIGGLFAGAVAGIGETFYLGLVDVYDLAVKITIFIAAMKLVRGQVVHAIREYGLTFLIYGLYLAAGLTNEAGFFGLTLQVMEATGNVAGDLAQMTLQGESERVEDCPDIVYVSTPISSGSGEVHQFRRLGNVGCPFAETIRVVFVEQTYDLVNWGANLETYEGGRCAATRDEIVRQSPFEDSAEPREMMEDAGCGELAEFNEEPTMERLGLAYLMAMTTWVVVWIFGIASLVVIGAQFLLIMVIVALPWALIFGLLPGYGRTIWWRWFAAGSKVVLVTIAVSGFAAAYLVALRAIVQVTEEESWFLRTFMMMSLAMLMLFGLVKVVMGARAAARLSVGRLSHRSQGNAPWLPAVAMGESPKMFHGIYYIAPDIRNAYQDTKTVVKRFIR